MKYVSRPIEACYQLCYQSTSLEGIVMFLRAPMKFILNVSEMVSKQPSGDESRWPSGNSLVSNAGNPGSTPGLSDM